MVHGPPTPRWAKAAGTRSTECAYDRDARCNKRDCNSVGQAGFLMDNYSYTISQRLLKPISNLCSLTVASKANVRRCEYSLGNAQRPDCCECGHDERQECVYQPRKVKKKVTRPQFSRRNLGKKKGGWRDESRGASVVCDESLYGLGNSASLQNNF